MNANTRRAASLYRRFVLLAVNATDRNYTGDVTALVARMGGLSDRFNTLSRSLPADQSALLVAHNNHFSESRERAQRRFGRQKKLY